MKNKLLAQAFFVVSLLGGCFLVGMDTEQKPEQIVYKNVHGDAISYAEGSTTACSYHDGDRICYEALRFDCNGGRYYHIRDAQREFNRLQHLYNDQQEQKSNNKFLRKVGNEK